MRADGSLLGRDSGDEIRQPSEHERRDRLRDRPEHRAGALRAAPETRRHDVEPGGIERRVRRRQQRRAADVEPHGRRQVAGGDAGDEQRRRAEVGDRRDPDPRLEVASPHHRIAHATAHERADHRAHDEQAEHELGRGLTGVVVTAHEQERERGQPREEEVAERGADDHQHVGRDRQDVANGRHKPERARIGLQHAPLVRLDAAPPGHVVGELVGRRRLVGFGLRPRPGLRDRLLEIDNPGNEPARAAAQRLRDGAVQLAREEEARDRQQDERRAPVDQARDAATDDEAGRGAGDLAAEDVRVHAAALARREVVARERGDRRSRGGGNGAEQQTREQQVRVVGREGAEQRRAAPQRDAEGEDRDPPDPVDQQPDRDREHRADQGRDRAEQSDLRVADVEAVLELRRDRADGGRVRTVQRENRPEHRDHARASGAAHTLDDLPAEPATRPPGRVGQAVLGQS